MLLNEIKFDIFCKIINNGACKITGAATAYYGITIQEMGCDMKIIKLYYDGVVKTEFKIDQLSTLHSILMMKQICEIISDMKFKVFRCEEINSIVFYEEF